MRILCSTDPFEQPRNWGQVGKDQEHSLFLVGPTPRSPDVPSWRPEALNILSRCGYKGLVYVPEPFSGDGYKSQIYWESMGLKYAHVIAAWVCRSFPDMPAFTTNIEWGEWFQHPKFVYGRPEEAEKKDYLDARYEFRDGEYGNPHPTRTVSRFGNKPHNTLSSLLRAATEGNCEVA